MCVLIPDCRIFREKREKKEFPPLLWGAGHMLGTSDANTSYQPVI